MKPSMLAAMALAAFAAMADAHRASDAFLSLQLEPRGARLTWSIALRDLEAAVGLDADGDRAITWGELRGAEARIAADLPRFLDIESAGGACGLVLADLQVEDRTDGRYAWLAAEARCDGAPERLRYGFLFDVDPTHRAIAVIDAGATTRSAVLSPDAPAVALAPAARPAAADLGSYLRAGMHHIWAGLDHILFLVTLLLPAVLVPRDRRWCGAERLALVAGDVLRVVTAFTLAHSATLALVALGFLRLPGAWVEGAIALSVVAAALNNLRPHAAPARAGMALAFGLVHGCGLAGALGELGLPPAGRLLALAAFNVGVEAGQLAIVAAVLPLAFLARGTAVYRRGIVAGGSAGVAALGTLWLAQRAGWIGAF